MTDSCASLVAYTRWADRTLLAPCAELTPAQYTLELGGSFPTLQATVAHLAGAAKLWSLRLAGLPYAGLEKSVVRWKVFRHIVNHGTYHRGQIANMLRQLGVKPPSTDLLYWDGS